MEPLSCLEGHKLLWGRRARNSLAPGLTAVNVRKKVMRQVHRHLDRAVQGLLRE